MKVFSINPINYNFRKTNPEKNTATLIKDSSENNLTFPSFQGSVQQVVTNGLRRAVIKNETSQAVYDKVFRLAKKLPPRTSLSEPRFFNVGNENFGYNIIKDYTGRTIVEIKNKAKSVNDWNTGNKDRTVLNCIFDSRGKLIHGELTQAITPSYSTGAFFIHTGREGRRLRIDDKTYRPISGKVDEWAIVPHESSRNTIGEENLRIKLENVLLSDLFLELASNRTSILL